MLRFFDAHNHLQDAWLTPHRATVLADLESVGVGAVVVNGTSELDWSEVAELCKTGGNRPSRAATAPRLLPSFGLHPWDVGNRSPQWQAALNAQLDADPHAFIGEIGLDRWILKSARANDPRLAGLRRAPIVEQVDVFQWQLQLAADRNLPATVHCLDAFGLLLETLQRTRRPSRGFLLHAYSGPAEMVPPFAELGAYFSFNGSFLDPRKIRFRATYSAVPLDRLLVETDAPAMRPPPNVSRFALPAADTGETINHPANVIAAYEGLAKWRGMRLESLAAAVGENFSQLFGRDEQSALAS